MNKKQLYWFEAKQLDRVTNFSTEVEIIKAANDLRIPFKYYCTFKSTKKYFGLENNIKYLGYFKNKALKAIEFQLLVVLKAICLILKGNNQVLIVNQDLVKHMMPASFINKLCRKSNRFIVDIRTTPTILESFDRDMEKFHDSFRLAVRKFDSFSFITPFMEKYVMSEYKVSKPTVTWSSGVDVELFNPNLYPNEGDSKPFIIFYHGGISESRGNLNLVKACEKLISSDYNIELVQLGICVDSSIPKYIADNKIENWCKLLPPVPLSEIPKHIANAHLPVLPFPDFMAWRVSSPIKLMEYLAMGKKVLAPKMEAFTNVFINHPDLIFYYDTKTHNQVEELYSSISLIIDKDLVGKTSVKDCRKFVSNAYTWEIQAKKLLNFAQTL